MSWWAIAIAVTLVLEGIFVHELCHALPAWWFGYPPKLICIGFPIKPIWRLGRLGKTELVLTPWLLGGAVVLDYGNQLESEQEIKKLGFLNQLFAYSQAFWNVSALKRTIITLCGPLGNLLQAIIVAMLVLGPGKGLGVIWLVLRALGEAMVALFSASVPLSALRSPIGLVGEMAPLIESSPLAMTWVLFIVLNLAFAVTNMLPIMFILDGGQIVLTWWIELWRKLGFNKDRLSRAGNTVTVYSFIGLVILSLALVIRDVVNIFW